MASFVKAVEKLDPSYVADRNVKNCGRLFGSSPKVMQSYHTI